MSVPLTRLLRKNTPFVWTEEQQIAFDSLKKAITSDRIIAYPDFSKTFVLATDASTTAIGAVLSQGEGHNEHPVAFASRALNPAEQRYSVTERELLAVVWACNHFQNYLLGQKFVLETDHIALTAALKLKDPTSRIGRWVIRLSEYSFEPRYRPGTQLRHADGLSRSRIASLHLLPFPTDLLKASQNIDPWIQNISKSPPEGTELIEGIWCRVIPIKGTDRIIYVPLMPSSLRDWLLQVCHSSEWAGHPGPAATEARVQRYGVWPKMNHHITQFVKACEVCQRRNTPSGLQPPIQKPYLPTCPSEIVGIDLVGPIPSVSGPKYILTIVDHFTKYAEAYPLTDISSRSIADTLIRKYFVSHGMPERIVSDRGANFTSDLIKELCQTYGIWKVQTTAYHPQSNGVVERFHRTLANIISKISKNKGIDWEVLLPVALAAYRGTVHNSTGYTPNYLTYGRELRLPDSPDWTKIQNRDLASSLRALQKVYPLVAQEINRMWDQREAAANHRRRPRYFQPGDRIYLRMMQPPKGTVKKYFCPWFGPYTVIQRLSEVTYQIEDTLHKRQIVHLARMKPAFSSQTQDEMGYTLFPIEKQRTNHQRDGDHVDTNETPPQDDMVFLPKIAEPAAEEAQSIRRCSSTTPVTTESTMSTVEPAVSSRYDLRPRTPINYKPFL
ncbi:unnamed protein product [Nesidiocoris tenuis]|uniref:RNA-directed DNA polymerase n=1 Tax=Nesidiocoris tenuis TaxID=355587 RepID=A0A6H5G1D2_9HEMI|nr:unnamed protein product [Nesidiocoris tenuis]